MKHSARSYRAVLESHPDLLAKAEAMPDADAAPSGGPELLHNTEAFNTRLVVLPRPAILPAALWAIGTHIFDAFETFPYLALLSPVKRCGKTRLTEVLEFLVSKPIRAVNISEAALFRVVEAEKPTLILDEAEALTGKGERAEAVRSLLNAGNRAGVSVPRCVGNSHELRFFPVFCPKVLCAIRKLPETILDRAIVVRMQRKRPEETVARLSRRRIKPEADELRGRIAAFAQAHRSAIERAYAAVKLDFLADRDAENFEPLFAILAVADPGRTDELRRAAEALTRQKAADAQDDSLTLRLLADIRAVWPDGVPAISTAELLARLKGVEDGPWAGDVELTPRGLARMLRPFEVASGTVRVGRETAKGYYRDALEAVFSLYLSAESVTCATTPVNIGDSSVFPSVTDTPCDGSKNGPGAV